MKAKKERRCFETLNNSISSLHSSFYSLGKKTKQWYLNKIWNPIVFSSSLIVQSIRLFIVLLFFLLLIFFIPIRSYIGLSLETDHPTILNSEIEECSFLAKKATFTDINECRVSFHPECITLTYLDESTLSLAPVTISAIVSINGKYDTDLTDRFSELIIQPYQDLNPSMLPQIDVIAPGFDNFFINNQFFYCDISRTNNNAIKDTSCDSIIFGNSDFTLNRIVHEFNFIGDKRKFDNEVIKKAIDNPVRVEISSCYVQFLSEEKIIRQCDANDTVVIFFPLCMDFCLATSGANCYFSGISNLQCKISQIHTLNLFGDGHITVTYTPDSKDYTILKQPITITSKDGSFLSSEISQLNDDGQNKEKTSYIISAFGFADAIHLADVSLLPDIFIWFKENVYLLPAMFVTVIIGSIQLIKINKEKENKRDEERENEVDKEEEKKTNNRNIQ